MAQRRAVPAGPRASVLLRAALLRASLIVLVAGGFALTALGVPAAGAGTPGLPATPAGTQLGWVLGQINAAVIPSDAQLEAHFSGAFLSHVPPAKIVAALAPIAGERPLRVSAVVAQDGAFELVVGVSEQGGGDLRVAIRVAPVAPYLIEGLLFQPVAAPLASWSAIKARLGALAPAASLYAAPVGGAPLATLNPTRVGAIGSAFKLYVLGALSQAVASGRARWTETLAIRDAWKSLPSGAMRDEPAGRRFTLLHYAEQMISVSDNTAADHLIHFLGRAAIQAQLGALGNSAPARDEPFLTTRELFALKLAAPAALRNTFARAGDARRRALLPRIDRLDPTLTEAAGWSAPRAIGTIEWFASPENLANALAALIARARAPGLAQLRTILSINPGIPLDPAIWHYAAFKGGSEPGVLSLTWYLVRPDGRAFVLSIVLNNPRRTIDQDAAVSIAQAAIALLARA